MSLSLRAKTIARSLARRAGLIPTLHRIRERISPSSSGYEDRFARAMLDAVRPGDCVWDVGANVGHYTAQFSERVGPSGSVIAFEPAPGPFAVVSGLGLANVKPHNVALGASEGTLPLSLDDDPLGSTHTFSRSASGGRSVDVRVTTGDALVREGVPRPNVMKVDVEGFEQDVLAGLSQELRERSLRALFLEIHFGLLESRGQRHGPSAIESILRRAGYKTRWVDSGHIAATR